MKNGDRTDESMDDSDQRSSPSPPRSSQNKKKRVLTLPEFRQQYEDLVKEIKDLVTKDDDEENITEQVEVLKKNLDVGSKLMQHVGTDNAKLHCTLKHLKVCLELADKKCRSMGTVKPFNIHKYLEILHSKNVNADDVYSERKFLRSLTSEMNQYTNSIFSIVSLLGVIDLHAAAPEKAAAKTRSVNRNKYNVDETSATQHQVVNSTVTDTVQKEDSLTSSIKMAAKLHKMCSGDKASGISLYDYGLQEDVRNTHKFVENLFNAACLGRDGFARITIDDKEKVTNQILRYSNWKIKDAQPPKEQGSTTSKNVRRNQHIISFNAKTFKTLMSKKGKSFIVDSTSKRKAASDLNQTTSKTAKKAK